MLAQDQRTAPLQTPHSTPIFGDGAYQLHVAASNVSSVVEYIGGWIFDQTRVGWTVSVLVPGNADDRPLRILGADLVDFDIGLAIHAAEPDLFSLAVSADLYDSNPRLRKLLDRRLRRGRPISAVWAHGEPRRAFGDLGIVEHSLSSAARVFKAHALQAAHSEPKVNQTERLFGAIGLHHTSVVDAQ